MSDTTPLSPACQALKDADAAWAALNTGASVRSVVDQNGERVDYSSANRAGLLTYIQTLQAQCGDYKALALGGCTARPMRFLF